MSDFLNKAEQYADSHEQQVDQGLDKVAEEADKRTDDRYDQQIDKGVQVADEHIGDEGH